MQERFCVVGVPFFFLLEERVGFATAQTVIQF